MIFEISGRASGNGEIHFRDCSRRRRARYYRYSRAIGPNNVGPKTARFDAGEGIRLCLYWQRDFFSSAGCRPGFAYSLRCLFKEEYRNIVSRGTIAGAEGREAQYGERRRAPSSSRLAKNITSDNFSKGFDVI